LRGNKPLSHMTKGLIFDANKLGLRLGALFDDGLNLS